MGGSLEHSGGVKRINGLKNNVDARVEHILREGNNLVDFWSNQFFTSTKDIICTNSNDLPTRGKAILQLDKTQIPNHITRNHQHWGFIIQGKYTYKTNIIH